NHACSRRLCPVIPSTPIGVIQSLVGTVPIENSELHENMEFGYPPSKLLPVLRALHLLTVAMATTFKSRTALQVENIALRHQLAVLRRSVKRPRLSSADRLLWAWLCEAWSDWRSFLVVVKPETVIGWHRKGFRLFWTWTVRRGQPGRPPVSKEIRQLIRRMS